jgi:hypothetical protein
MAAGVDTLVLALFRLDEIWQEDMDYPLAWMKNNPKQPNYYDILP